MKDQRFIELVNLYIDRQITLSEAAELESEIQGNPSRRAIYRQYCQMHQATRQVYESFRAPAAGQESAHAVNRSVVTRFETEESQPRSRWGYYAAGLAAACLALVFVRLNPPPATAANLMANMGNPAPAKAVVAPLVSLAAVPMTVAPATRRSPAPETDYAALLATMRQEDQRAVASGQIQSSRVPSLFDDGIFDAQQILPANSQRVFRGKQTPVQQTEFTAWQFQR